MATKSITKNVVIKNNRRCLNLLNALEKSGQMEKRQSSLSKEVRDMTAEQMKQFFADKE